MACFLVPTTEAIIMTVVTKLVKSGEKEPAAGKGAVPGKIAAPDAEAKIPFSRKLKWLTNLLWGGSFLLAYEHLWHGEVVPWFPFLTAAENPQDAATMLHEMSTVGVSMAILVTAFWLCMVLISNVMSKKSAKTGAAREGGRA